MPLSETSGDGDVFVAKYKRKGRYFFCHAVVGTRGEKNFALSFSYPPETFMYHDVSVELSSYYVITYLFNYSMKQSPS